MGLSQDNRAAPFEHRKVPVRFFFDNGIQNRAETARLPPGSPTVHLRAFYGLLRAVYDLSAVVRSHENAGRIGSSLLSTPAPARLVKTLPGPLRIVGHPTGTQRVPHGNGQNYCFTRRTGPLMDMWEQLAQHTGARTTSKNSPGALENRRAPYWDPTGTARKWPKLLFYSPYGALNGYVTAA